MTIEELNKETNRLNEFMNADTETCYKMPGFVSQKRQKTASAFSNLYSQVNFENSNIK